MTDGADKQEQREIAAHQIWGAIAPTCAPVTRPWMNATQGRFAYRCLPMVIANQAGWFVLNDHAFEAIWDGGSAGASIRIRPVDKTKPSRMVQSHFGEGVITWNIPFLFRTSPGYNLLVRGPSNWIKDGVQALEGIVETDWAVQTFTMNWKFTRPRRWVRFEADEPICMVVPQRRGELESFLTRLTPLDRSPELNEAFTEWSRSRDRFQVISKLKGSQANEQQWEKHYFRGQAPGLAQTSEDHQVGLSLRPFLPDDERRD